MYDISNWVLGVAGIASAICAAKLYFISNINGAWIMFIGFILAIGAAITPKGDVHAYLLLGYLIYIIVVAILIFFIKRNIKKISKN